MIHWWTIRTADEEFGVPHSTLFDHVEFGVEEKELVQFLIGCARIGYTKTRSLGYCFSKSYGGKKENKALVEVSITMGWWYSFKSRHPQLTVQTASRLAYCCAVAQDLDVISNYFNLLEETLLQNGLIEYTTVTRVAFHWIISQER